MSISKFDRNRNYKSISKYFIKKHEGKIRKTNRLAREG
jgi:hypothetical protein